MFKKLFIATLLYAAALYVMHQAVFGDVYTLFSISDAIFYVALPVFFISLISITNATSLFIWFGYSIKGLFSRSSRQTVYHKYYSERMKRTVSIVPVYVFIVSILLIITSLILANMIM